MTACAGLQVPGQPRRLGSPNRAPPSAPSTPACLPLYAPVLPRYPLQPRLYHPQAAVDAGVRTVSPEGSHATRLGSAPAGPRVEEGGRACVNNAMHAAGVVACGLAHRGWIAAWQVGVLCMRLEHRRQAAPLMWQATGVRRRADAARGCQWRSWTPPGPAYVGTFPRTQQRVCTP